MKKMIFFIFLFPMFFILASPILSSAENEFKYGEIWNHNSKDINLAWVWGFTSGQEVIFEELKIKNSKKFKYSISVKNADVLSEIMRQYYADAANTYISWKYMTYVAKMKLKGNSKEEINKELEFLRAFASRQRNSKQE